ncbi:endonuclease III [Pendulispora brunnea]|uniref:Endonuclease III n=1 Tax=Pendulispora brunnea TaxID=2905690 RepID=A0ABZ2KGR3_9BACT
MLTARQMSAVLTKVARFVEGRDHLAVTRVSLDGDPFAVLVSTIISLRTRDEVTDVVSPKLLAVAPDAKTMANTPVERIAELIFPAGFYRNKAQTLQEIARTLLDEHDGRVPDTLEGLLELRGVGRKTANLVLTLGHRKPGICVDIHVHRISNRLGFVRTKSPDETEMVLRDQLPRRWWIPINDILVTFGRVHCTPLSPHCSTCPVANVCHRVDVGRAR